MGFLCSSSLMRLIRFKFHQQEQAYTLTLLIHKNQALQDHQQFMFRLSAPFIQQPGPILTLSVLLCPLPTHQLVQHEVHQQIKNAHYTALHRMQDLGTEQDRFQRSNTGLKQRILQSYILHTASSFCPPSSFSHSASCIIHLRSTISTCVSPPKCLLTCSESFVYLQSLQKTSHDKLYFLTKSVIIFSSPPAVTQCSG